MRADPGDLVEDDLLRLVLMCTHPALDPAAASALTLRLVLGVSTADIARLFLVPEPTMAARITRAKKKIVAAGIPFAVPSADDLPERLDTVAQTAYLAFTAGYAPGSGPDVVRADLAGEAVRLVRVVLRLRPEEPVLVALLALMLLQHSRRDARADAAGSLVLLPDQDRSCWHRDEIAEATAASAEETDWRRVVALYDALVGLTPTPSARLARAVAVAEDQGPRAGLAALEGLDDELPHSHRLPAVRAELLGRAGDVEAARAAYDLAVERCRNQAERDLLVRRREGLGRGG